MIEDTSKVGKLKLAGISLGNPTNEKCIDCNHWKPASERPHRPFDGCEKYDEEDPNAVCSCFVRSQKSMDDDNPTVPVNRGAAGVYIPEPNEKERAKKDMMNSIARYIRIGKDEMLVENVTVDKKCYCVAITYEYEVSE